MKYIISTVVNDLLELVIIILIVLGVTLFFGYVVIAVEKKTCESKAIVMEIEYKFNIFSGCLVKYKNKFIPIQNLREIIE
jgi:hypothetical protein